jgi:hypothetical protein
MRAAQAEIRRLATLVRQLQGGVLAGEGSPEGIVEAGVSVLYRRRDGAPGTLLYQKQSGTGDTGWVAIA